MRPPKDLQKYWDEVLARSGFVDHERNGKLLSERRVRRERKKKLLKQDFFDALAYRGMFSDPTIRQVTQLTAQGKTIKNISKILNLPPKKIKNIQEDYENALRSDVFQHLGIFIQDDKEEE